MTTTNVPVEIVCPAWCTIAPEDHAASLWDLAGNCLHRTAELLVEDPTGHQVPLEAPRRGEPVRAVLYSYARPDGTEMTGPFVHVEQLEGVTVGQALEVAAAIATLVQVYRAAGGLA